jgi:hypothetical protein
MNESLPAWILDPYLVAKVRSLEYELARGLMNQPWTPSPSAKTLAEKIRDKCPTMARELDAERILYAWAEMMQGEVRQLAKMFRANGMNFDAESYANLGLVPRGPASEVAWLEANCLGYKSAPDPEIGRSRQRDADQLIVTNELRKKYALICGKVWKAFPEMRDLLTERMDPLLRRDSALNWVVSKMDYFPKFPADEKAMQKEIMDFLTGFRIQMDPEYVPTLEEAMADPQEFLIGMAELLEGEMDPTAGERA